MLNFIDTYYHKIIWLIILLGFFVIFTASDYLSLILFSYLLVRAVKHRDLIRKTLRNTPISSMIIYAIGMILLISALTAVMLFSGGFIKEYNIPGFLQYIYVAIVLVGSMFFYVWFMAFLIKLWNRKRSMR